MTQIFGRFRSSWVVRDKNSPLVPTYRDAKFRSRAFQVNVKYDRGKLHARERDRESFDLRDLYIIESKIRTKGKSDIKSFFKTRLKLCVLWEK